MYSFPLNEGDKPIIIYLFNTLIVVLFLLNLCRYYDFYISVVGTNQIVQLTIEEWCHTLLYDWVMQPLSRGI